MAIINDSKKVNSVISSRYIERVYPSKEKLAELLLSGEKLKIYIGIDATGPQLHLGHSTNFLFLKKLQELGHEIILLIGDFTARIGDPTGRISSRKPLKKSEVLKNCRGYKRQTGKILDFDSKINPAKLKFNSQWLSKLRLEQIIELTAKMTVGQMIKRDMFKQRIGQKKEIYLNEFLYPLLQGYDSVAMDVNIEVGGNDQTFNMMVGRQLVMDYLSKEKLVITTKLLVNPKTNKKLMSKSEGNFIALDEKAGQMYGKVMALPDEEMLEVFKLCTELSDAELAKIENLFFSKRVGPKEIKSRLAREIVSLYHGQERAQSAEREFNRIFKEKKNPSIIKEVKIQKKSIDILDLLVKTRQASSKSEAKRLIVQKSVRIDGVLKNSWRESIGVKKGMIIKVGKRKFVKIF